MNKNITNKYFTYSIENIKSKPLRGYELNGQVYNNYLVSIVYPFVYCSPIYMSDIWPSLGKI